MASPPGIRKSLPDGRWHSIGLGFGPLAAAVLLVGVVGLAHSVPGYNSVRQTVSEIGEVGSPARMQFAVMTCAVAVCLLVFARALSLFATRHGLSKWPAYLIGFMALPVAGTGIFAFPHPLHNVFGISELVAYPAPLVLAILWRRRPAVRGTVAISIIAAVFVFLALALNLSALPRDNWVWAHVQPYYGLVQRFLFASWFAWIAVLGAALRRRAPLQIF